MALSTPFEPLPAPSDYASVFPRDDLLDLPVEEVTRHAPFAKHFSPATNDLFQQCGFTRTCSSCNEQIDLWVDRHVEHKSLTGIQRDA